MKMHFAVHENCVAAYVGQCIGPDYESNLQPHISEIWYAVSRNFRKTGDLHSDYLMQGERSKVLEKAGIKLYQLGIETS